MSLGCNIVFIAVLFLATLLNACHTLSSKTPNGVAHISNASRGPWHRERRWGFRCRAMSRPSFSSLLRLPVASRYGAAGATAIGEFGESLSARRGGGYCCRPVPCPPSSSFLPPAGAAAAGAEWCGTCCRKRSFNSCSLYSFLSSSCSIALRVRLNSCKRRRPSASRSTAARISDPRISDSGAETGVGDVIGDGGIPFGLEPPRVLGAEAPAGARAVASAAFGSGSWASPGVPPRIAIAAGPRRGAGRAREVQ